MLEHNELLFLQESDRIEGYNYSLLEYAYLETAQTMCHVDAYEYIEFQDIITPAVIEEMHRMLIEFDPKLPSKYKGKYRDCDVWIAGRKGLDPADISKSIEDFCTELNYGKKKPLDLHVIYEHIHPFADGNGRSGRLLWAWHLNKLGRKVKPILSSKELKFTNEERKELEDNLSFIIDTKGFEFNAKRRKYYRLF